MHELKEIIAENFVNFQARYVPRECNRVAHELASIGSMSDKLESVALLVALKFCCCCLY